MLCPIPRALLGHGAPRASASSSRRTAAQPKRAVRNVKGSASGAAYFATMKPLDHNSAKVSGVARMKNWVKDMAGMGPAPCPIRSRDARALISRQKSPA
jgi:hypothetical protein